MKKWKCKVCGYIHDGEEPPEQCPRCGAKKEQFEECDDETASKIERARHSNALHARLIDLARQIEYCCNDGIEDNLDPGCVGVFTKTREMCWEMMKMSMAEIEVHVGKKKWG